MLIGDLTPGVIKKLRNRNDLTNDIPTYIKKAIFDLTQNYEFEELKLTGPVTNFKLNQNEYPKSGNGNIFIYEQDVALTFIDSWFVWFTDSTPILGQDTGFEIKFRNLRVVEPMSKIFGIPTFYTIVGRMMVIGFVPNIAYATQMRYQRQHPFPDLTGIPAKDAPVLNTQVVYMPDDWQDIIEYVAAAKACDDIGMPEVGTQYNQRVFGYKDKFGNDTPGIIKVRQSEQQRHSTYNEKQLRPNIRRFCR